MAIHRKILRWLETELFEGNIQLGQNLPDDQQIARAIGVGRSRTRDALKTLEDMELVRLYSGRGKEIIPRLYEEPAAAAAGPLRLHMSTSRFPTRDMLQTRILLESWAVSNIDPEKVSFDEVDEALEVLQDDTLSIGEFLDQLLTFHHLLARLAGNELVVGLLVAIRQPSFDSLLSLMGRLPLWSSTMTRIRVENRAIVDAVKDGDARTARELIAHQLQELYSEAGIELDEETSTPNGIPGDSSDFEGEYEEESEAVESSEEQTFAGEGSAAQDTNAAQDAAEDSGRSRDISAGSGAQGGESGAADASQNSASGEASSQGGEGGSSQAPQETESSDEQENAAGTLPKIIRAGSTVSRRRRGHLRLPQPAAVGFDSSDPADSAPQTSEAAETETAGSETAERTDDTSSAQPESAQKTARVHEPELESVQPEFEDDVIPVEETASAEPTTDRVDVEQPIVEASVADDDLLAEPVSGPHAPARSAENREDAPQGSTGSGTSAEQAASPGQETNAEQENSSAQETAAQEAAAAASDTGQSISAAEESDAAAADESTSAPTSSSEDSAEKSQETKAAASAEVYVEKAPVGEISAEELVATGLIPWRSAHVEQQGTDTSQLKAAQGTEGTQSAQGSSQEQAVRAPARRVAPPVRPAQFATRRPSKPTGSERVGFLQRVKHYFGLDLPHTQAIRLIEAQEAAEKTAAIELEKAAIAEQAAALKAMREKTAAAGKTEQSAQSSQAAAPSQDTAQGAQTQQAASESVAQKIKTEAAQKSAAPTLSPRKPVPAVKSASTVKPGAVKQPEQSEPARAERREAAPEAASAQTGSAQKDSNGAQKNVQQPEPVAAQQKTAQSAQKTGQGSTSPKPQEPAKSAEQGKQGTGQSAQQSAEPQTERSQAATKSESALSGSSSAQPQQGSAQKSEESEGASAKTGGVQTPAHASDADQDKADKQESTASPKDAEASSEQAEQTSGMPMPRPVPAVSRPEADEVTSLPVASKTAEPLENSGPSEAVEVQPVSARMAAAKATATPAPASASSNPQGVAEQIKKVEKTAVKNFSQGGSALSKTKKNRRKRR